MGWLPSLPEGALAHVIAWLVLAPLAFRCVPFVAYSLLSRKVAWDAKVSSLAVFAAIVLTADTLGVVLTDVFYASLAFGYFVLVSIGIYTVRGRALRLPGWAVLAVAAGAYVLLPALTVRSVIVVPMLVVGWDSMLSAYSYVQDTQDGRSPGRLSDCLFFILVNPVLVYADRGVEISTPSFRWAGLSRCLVGLLTWAVQGFAAMAIAIWIEPVAAAATGGRSAPFLVLFWTSAFVLYLQHSGLASVQIGLMRLAGWRIPERYNYPFLATSPSDFWRRWNSYIASWARRYLFLPCALHIGRTRWLSNRAAKGTAALATFLAIGALHALVQYLAIRAGETRPWGPFHVMGLFAAFAIAFVTWEGIARWKPLAGYSAERLRLGQARSIASWLLFSNVMCVMTWLALSPFG